MWRRGLLLAALAYAMRATAEAKVPAAGSTRTVSSSEQPHRQQGDGGSQQLPKQLPEHKHEPKQQGTLKQRRSELLAALLEGSALGKRRQRQPLATETPYPPGSNLTQDASDFVDNLLNSTNKTQRMYSMIRTIALAGNMKADEVEVKAEIASTARKLRHAFEIINECAEMISCPQAGCCDPRRPRLAVYKQAVADAYMHLSEIYILFERDNALVRQIAAMFNPPPPSPTTTTPEPPPTTTEKENKTRTVIVYETQNAAYLVSSLASMAMVVMGGVGVMALMIMKDGTMSLIGGGKGLGGGEEAYGEGEEW